MLTPAQITALRRAVGESIGLGSWLSPYDGTAAATAALSDADRLALHRELLVWASANPGQFSDIQLAALRKLAAWTPADPYTLADAAADFVGEIGTQASDLNETLNPFSARNRGYVLAAVAVGLVLYFAGPSIIAALRAPVKAAK